MPNQLYGHGRQRFLEGSIAWLTDTIKAALVDFDAYYAGQTGGTIASSTNATPIVVTTSAAHGFTDGDAVVIGKHVTNTNANNLGTGTKLYAHVLTTTTFSLFTDAALTAGVAGNGVGGATGGVISLTRDTFFNPAVSTAGVVVAAGVTITSPTSTLGVADGADITWTAVSGAQCEIALIYKDTGTATTSPLIAYIDQATNLPVTPNGGNITVTWDNTANRIFVL